MNECFSEKQLLSYCLGESTEAEQAHLRTCIVCAKRFKQMAGRMDLITQTLILPPPPTRSYVPVFLPRIVTAAIAIALVFTLGLWSGQRLGTHRNASAPANLAADARRTGSAQSGINAGPPTRIASDSPLSAADIYVEYLRDSFEVRVSCNQDSLNPECL